MDRFYPNLDWAEVWKCDSCGACGKETLEHFLFLFDCGRYMEERLALFRRIRERLRFGEECDVKPFSDPDGCRIGRCVDSWNRRRIPIV